MARAAGRSGGPLAVCNWTTTPNAAARKRLPPALEFNWVAYPPQDVLARSEFQEYVGPAADIYQRHWETLRAGRR